MIDVPEGAGAPVAEGDYLEPSSSATEKFRVAIAFPANLPLDRKPTGLEQQLNPRVSLSSIPNSPRTLTGTFAMGAI